MRHAQVRYGSDDLLGIIRVNVPDSRSPREVANGVVRIIGRFRHDRVAHFVPRRAIQYDDRVSFPRQAHTLVRVGYNVIEGKTIAEGFYLAIVAVVHSARRLAEHLGPHASRTMPVVRHVRH